MAMRPSQVRRKNAQVPELMGLSEVAAELGIKTNNLAKIVGLPEPIPQELERGRLWRADVIREFAAERRERGPGRRRKA
jgi:hypothetical protein